MALHINDAETDRLVRDLAQATGETLTVAINKAVKERLSLVKTQQQTSDKRFLAEIKKIQAMVGPELRNQTKTGREMINEMYDENGLPK